MVRILHRSANYELRDISEGEELRQPVSGGPILRYDSADRLRMKALRKRVLDHSISNLLLASAFRGDLPILLRHLVILTLIWMAARGHSDESAAGL